MTPNFSHRGEPIRPAQTVAAAESLKASLQKLIERASGDEQAATTSVVQAVQAVSQRYPQGTIEDPHVLAELVRRLLHDAGHKYPLETLAASSASVAAALLADPTASQRLKQVWDSITGGLKV